MSIDWLDIAGYRWDTTRRLFDGEVGFDGLDARMHTGALPDIFEGMLRDEKFDVAELGLTYLLRSVDAGGPFVALPVFPARAFRLSCVWVNSASGITEPSQLNGRTVGEFGLFGQDSGSCAKGIMSDGFGFDARSCRWLIGGLDKPMRGWDFVPNARPKGWDIDDAPADKTLAGMLAGGEIDALFTANVPQLVREGSTALTQLFSDYEQQERDYFRRTGIFPVMHTVVAKRELLERSGNLARTLFAAYQAAKDAEAEQYLQNERVYEVTSMQPWMNSLVDRNRALLGDDWWPYGIAANRTALDAALRWHHEQGLTRRLLTVEEVFAPQLLDT